MVNLQKFFYEVELHTNAQKNEKKIDIIVNFKELDYEKRMCHRQTYH